MDKRTRNIIWYHTRQKSFEKELCLEKVKWSVDSETEDRRETLLSRCCIWPLSHCNCALQCKLIHSWLYYASKVARSHRSQAVWLILTWSKWLHAQSMTQETRRKMTLCHCVLTRQAEASQPESFVRKWLQPVALIGLDIGNLFVLLLLL